MDETISLELLKLLLQVAWADHTLAADEVETLHHYAGALGLSPPTIAQFQRWVERRDPLPPPNMGVLRQHRAVVLRACARLSQADGVLHQDEHHVMRDVMEMLSGS